MSQLETPEAMAERIFDDADDERRGARKRDALEDLTKGAEEDRTEIVTRLSDALETTDPLVAIRDPLAELRVEPNVLIGGAAVDRGTALGALAYIPCAPASTVHLAAMAGLDDAGSVCGIAWRYAGDVTFDRARFEASPGRCAECYEAAPLTCGCVRPDFCAICTALETT